MFFSAAANLLPAHIRQSVEIGIHGANLEMQEEAFQNEIKSLLESSKDVVTVYGAYENHHVLPLMSGYDWIVVPSICGKTHPS